MNLLEQYIGKVISETLIPLEETKKHKLNGQYVRVEAIIKCYGQESKIETLFPLNDWEEYKKQGYYMA